MLIDGRNQKIKPMGFDVAATVLTTGFSSEAASNLTRMVKDVARQYSYDDSKALKRLQAKLNTASQRTKTQPWASEVLTHLADAKSKRATA